MQLHIEAHRQVSNWSATIGLLFTVGSSMLAAYGFERPELGSVELFERIKTSWQARWASSDRRMYLCLAIE